MSLIWEFNPGQYSISLALLFDFSIPMWPWCTFSNISFLIVDGITIRALSKMISSITDSSSLMFQYYRMLSFTWDLLSGHPDKIVSFRTLSCLSTLVSFLISSSLDSVAGKFEVTRCTWKLISFSRLSSAVSRSGALESISGMRNSSRLLYDCVVVFLHSGK